MQFNLPASGFLGEGAYCCFVAPATASGSTADSFVGSFAASMLLSLLSCFPADIKRAAGRKERRGRAEYIAIPLRQVPRPRPETKVSVEEESTRVKYLRMII